MPKLSMRWSKDPLGYEIKYPDSSRVPSRRRTVLTDQFDATIAPKSGQSFFYDPFAMPGLLARLASCRTVSDVLEFVNHYGFLREQKDAYSLRFFHYEVKVARSVVEAKRLGRWHVLYNWMRENSHTIRLNPVLLEADPPELFFQPTTLSDAAYLQFFEEVATRTQLKLCARPGCGEWFKYGPGTSHRNTAQYCSPRCQKAHAYVKLKEGQS
jgi:hypothetical protein